MNDLFVLEDVGRDKTLVKILEVNEDSIDSANKYLILIKMIIFLMRLILMGAINLMKMNV